MLRVPSIRLKPLLHIHLGHSALWFCTCCSSSHPIRLQTWALIHYQKNKSLKKPQINLNFWKEVKGNKNRTKQHVSNTEELKLKTWFELWMNKTENHFFFQLYTLQAPDSNTLQTAWKWFTTPLHSPSNLIPDTKFHSEWEFTEHSFTVPYPNKEKFHT